MKCELSRRRPTTYTVQGRRKINFHLLVGPFRSLNRATSAEREEEHVAFITA